MADPFFVEEAPQAQSGVIKDPFFVEEAPASAEIPASTTRPSISEAASLGAVQGVTLGWAPEIAKLGVVTPESAMFSDRPSQQELDEAGERLRARSAEAREAHPIAYGAGEIAGSLPAVVATGGTSGAAGLLPAAGRVAATTALGTVAGAGAAGPGERASGALTGGLLGAVGTGAAELRSGLARYFLAKKAASAAADATASAVTKRTIGQIRQIAPGATSDEALQTVIGTLKKHGVNDATSASAALDKVGKQIGAIWNGSEASVPVSTLETAFDAATKDVPDFLKGVLKKSADDLASKAVDGQVPVSAIHDWQKTVRTMTRTRAGEVKGVVGGAADLANDFRNQVVGLGQDAIRAENPAAADKLVQELNPDFRVLLPLKKDVQAAADAAAAAKAKPAPPDTRSIRKRLWDYLKGTVTSPNITGRVPAVVPATALELAQPNTAQPPEVEPRAAGGPVEAFKAYRTGERGPELVVPDTVQEPMPVTGFEQAGPPTVAVTATPETPAARQKVPTYKVAIDTSNPEARKAAEQAVADWKALGCDLTIVDKHQGGPGTMTIHWDEGLDRSLNAPSDAIAATKLVGPKGSRGRAADIAISRLMMEGQDPRTIIGHEIGHVLGLDDNSNSASIMREKIPPAAHLRPGATQLERQICLNEEPVPKAAGGAVDPSRPYLVGEEGPEVVVPQQAGTVVPTDRVRQYIQQKYARPPVESREKVAKYLSQKRQAFPAEDFIHSQTDEEYRRASGEYHPAETDED